MLTRAILFRLLLSFSLFLNGTAVASPMIGGMDMSAGGSASLHHGAPALVVVTAMRGCHRVDKVADALPTHAVGSVSRQTSAPALPDCCRNGSCRCACVHALPLVAPMVEFRAMVLLGVHPARALRAGHEPPTARLLIRPPIV